MIQSLHRLRRYIPKALSLRIEWPEPPAYEIRVIEIEQQVPDRPPVPVGWFDAKALANGYALPERERLHGMIDRQSTREFYVRIGELAANAGYAQEVGVNRYYSSLPPDWVTVSFWSEEDLETVCGTGETWEAAYISAVSQMYGWEQAA